MAISILFATVSGNTQDYAEKLHKALKAEGIDAELKNVADFKKPFSVPTGTVLYMTSTYNDGDQPDDALDYYDYLTGLGDDKSKMSGVKYCVFGLGSTSYSHFCRASEQINSAFKSLGAAPILDLVRSDSDADPDADFESWKKSVIAALK